MPRTGDLRVRLEVQIEFEIESLNEDKYRKWRREMINALKGAFASVGLEIIEGTGRINGESGSVKVQFQVRLIRDVRIGDAIRRAKVILARRYGMKLKPGYVARSLPT